MIHQQIKELVFSSVEHVVSNISQYAVHPDSDFKRSKKIPAQNRFAPHRFHFFMPISSFPSKAESHH